MSNPLGNSHGNNSKKWSRLMEAIQGGKIQEYDERFREGELMGLEEARQQEREGYGYQAQRERINRRRSMPQNKPSDMEVRKGPLAREAERQASMSSATAVLVKRGIPEDVIRDVINQYV
jgi:hypothetical protein